MTLEFSENKPKLTVLTVEKDVDPAADLITVKIEMPGGNKYLLEEIVYDNRVDTDWITLNNTVRGNLVRLALVDTYGDVGAAEALGYISDFVRTNYLPDVTVQDVKDVLPVSRQYGKLESDGHTVYNLDSQTGERTGVAEYFKSLKAIVNRFKP